MVAAAGIGKARVFHGIPPGLCCMCNIPRFHAHVMAIAGDIG